MRPRPGILPLARFEPPLGLINHIDFAPAANHAAIFMPIFQGLKGTADFHRATCLKFEAWE